MRSGERETQKNTLQTDILILGGGCGGLETAIELRKRVPVLCHNSMMALSENLATI
jgi:NADH dehydrogenase FAD-containing subunit